MVMNYESIGENPAIPHKYRVGVELMNKHARALEEAGFLPKQFPGDPRLLGQPQVFKGSENMSIEKAGMEEINALESYIGSIKRAISNNDEKTLAGFANLRQNLNKRNEGNFPTGVEGIRKILNFFDESMDQYRSSPDDLYVITEKTARKIYHKKRNKLDPRQMRFIIFYYNLLPDIVKTPKTLVQEEEIRDIERFKYQVERQLVYHS